MIYAFNRFTLDSKAYELARDGEVLAVEPQVFNVLVFLIENRDRIVGKDELIDAVWDGRAISDGALNSRINLVRRAVGDDGKTQAVVKTFPRRGFRFVADIEEPEANEMATPNDLGGPGHGTLLDQPSIIVLPFKNLSNDPEQDYFSDGITEDIIAALSRFHWFYVIASGTTFSFKGQSTDVKQVAADIGVRYVLEGSVRKAGDRVRISAQLNDGRSGAQLWAERYDRDLEDIFALQDEMTLMVVGAVEPELAGAEQRQANAKLPQNLDAWDLYQRAMYLINRRNRADNERSIPLLEQAIEIGAENGIFHSGLSFAHFMSAVQVWADDIAAARDTALHHARMAVDIDQDDAMAHTVLGAVHFHRHDNEEALAELRHAVRLNPSSAVAHMWLGTTLTMQHGRPEEALEHFQLALKLSPNDIFTGPTYMRGAGAYLAMGDLDAAYDFAQRGLRYPSTQFWGLTMAMAIFAFMDVENELDAMKQRLFKRQSTFTVDFFAKNYPGGSDTPVGVKIMEGLRKAGVPEK